MVAGHRPLTGIRTRRQTPYLDLFRTPTYSWKSEQWKNVSNCFTKNCFCKLLMPCVMTLTAAYSKVLSSMENVHIMLEMAGKCSNDARNRGLCFSFWIMLFEADYAKNYASILYQCLCWTHGSLKKNAHYVIIQIQWKPFWLVTLIRIRRMTGLGGKIV